MNKRILQKNRYLPKRICKIKVQITTKICKDCGLNKIADSFYDHPRRHDGKDSVCKKCRIEKVKYKWKRKNRIAQICYRQKYPDRYETSKIVASARRLGKMIPQPCAKCNSTKNIDGHHLDYSKPLEVIWLCRQCHKDLHAHRLILSERVAV